MAVGEGGGAVSGGSSQVRERSSGRQYIGGSETRHGKHFPLSLYSFYSLLVSSGFGQNFALPGARKKSFGHWETGSGGGL